MTGARVFEATWAAHAAALKAVRRAVFVAEQGITEAEEWDGEDEHSRHFLAEDQDGQPIGTARLLPSGQIGRMAVLPKWRHQGIGARLLCLAVTAGGDQRVFLHAQVDAIGFYERAGFVAAGEPFLEAGITHRRMALPR